VVFQSAEHAGPIGDEPGGTPFLVDAASPQVSDTLIDNANSGTDLIVVNGASSSPLFDHVEVLKSHCAFHLNEGKDITIQNSNVHDSVYGMMVSAAVGTQITDSNFVNNADVHIGVCITGDVTVTGSYFDKAAFDTTCSSQTNTLPSTTELKDVGPRP
jgi:hypothetical protein